MFLLYKEHQNKNLLVEIMFCSKTKAWSLLKHKNYPAEKQISTENSLPAASPTVNISLAFW